MQRRVIVISLCFLLGVVTSVVIAWWCVLWDGSVASGDDPSSKLGEFQVNGWYGVVKMRSGVVTVEARNASEVDLQPTAPPHRLDPPWWIDLDVPPEESSEIIARATGWPWACLHSVSERHEVGFIPEWDFDHHGVFVGTNPLTDLSENWVDVDRLPVAPLWTGLLGDALVLGAGWYVIAFIGLPWRWGRIRRRKKLNRCQYCGYDQRSSASRKRCSECGRDPQDRGPLFGAMSVRVLTTVCVVMCAAVIAFGFKFAATRPYSVIHYAAYRGDVETVKQELARGTNVEAIETVALVIDIDYTPIAAAAAGGKAETVQLLIDAGANVNVSVEIFGSPLAAAMAHEDLNAARCLIEAGADVNAFSTIGFLRLTALWLAAGVGHMGGLELLVENGFEVERAEQSLWMAALQGHCDFVKRMIELGAPITDLAMRGAVRSSDLQMFQLMLEYGGDPLSQSQNDGTLLFEVMSRDEGLEIARLLIEAGVDVNVARSGGNTALWDAVEDVELVRFLLDHGADVAAATEFGETVVERAATRGSLASLQLLLERGADPEELRGRHFANDYRRQEIIDRALAELDEKP